MLWGLKGSSKRPTENKRKDKECYTTTHDLSSLWAWHTANAEDKQSSIMPLETTYIIRIIRIFPHKCISYILPFTQRVSLYPSKSIISVQKQPNTLNFILGLIG